MLLSCNRQCRQERARLLYQSPEGAVGSHGKAHAAHSRICFHKNGHRTCSIPTVEVAQSCGLAPRTSTAHASLRNRRLEKNKLQRSNRSADRNMLYAKYSPSLSQMGEFLCGVVPQTFLRWWNQNLYRTARSHYRRTKHSKLFFISFCYFIYIFLYKLKEKKQKPQHLRKNNVCSCMLFMYFNTEFTSPGIAVAKLNNTTSWSCSIWSVERFDTAVVQLKNAAPSTEQKQLFCDQSGYFQPVTLQLTAAWSVLFASLNEPEVLSHAFPWASSGVMQ